MKNKEIVEEAAEKYSSISFNKQDLYDGFIEGAKWQVAQDKNKYSEEEVIDLLQKMKDWPTTFEGRIDIKEWFEQHKKK
jgi:hypothetical protein